VKSPRKIVIAIDGPAASGKSTTAKLVARELGYLHVDTGAMYRAIALKVVEEKIPLDSEATIRSIAESASIRLESEDGKQNVFLNGRNVTREIRSPAVTKAVSRVSSYQSVRDVLVREQRAVASGGGVVLEGRDIGTVVLPHAELKIFMSANVAERARRRKKDLSDAGVDIGESDLVREIIERDRLDSSRTVSPLKKADDAVELDTSNLTIEEQVAYIVKRARSIIGT